MLPPTPIKDPVAAALLDTLPVAWVGEAVKDSAPVLLTVGALGEGVRPKDMDPPPPPGDTLLPALALGVKLELEEGLAAKVV